MKCAVFSCMGLGDGLLALIVSHNFRRAGWEVDTFHPFLAGLQEWFPGLPIKPFPEIVPEYDQYIVVYEKSPAMQKVMAHCLERYPEKTKILNPIATLNRDYPFWEVGRFEGDRCMAHNLYYFCKEGLSFSGATEWNGVVIPPRIRSRMHKRRVVLHPASSRAGKNWPKEKFLDLAALLRKKGFEPVFILTAEEKKEWEDVEAPHFASLSEVADFVAESGFMIGNDSGIGHLASALGLPTVTICRHQRTGVFWRPGWTQGALVYPSVWIPNMKGWRLRDKYWKTWISSARVMKAFERLSHGVGEESKLASLQDL